MFRNILEGKEVLTFLTSFSISTAPLPLSQPRSRRKSSVLIQQPRVWSRKNFATVFLMLNREVSSLDPPLPTEAIFPNVGLALANIIEGNCLSRKACHAKFRGVVIRPNMAKRKTSVVSNLKRCWKFSVSTCHHHLSRALRVGSEGRQTCLLYAASACANIFDNAPSETACNVAVTTGVGIFRSIVECFYSCILI
jgi:hypothetical protein